MKTGTKSLLFGVHQFLCHPLTVILAWKELYGNWPNLKELICIIVHDWGYWGKSNMDDVEGKKHPELGAEIAHSLLDKVIGWNSAGPHTPDIVYIKDTYYYDLCLFHSRSYSRNGSKEPSCLCWADKLSIKYEPWWLYLPRAWASGEIHEYRKASAHFGCVPLTATHRRWFAWVKDRLIKQGLKREASDHVDFKRIVMMKGSTFGKTDSSAIDHILAYVNERVQTYPQFGRQCVEATTDLIKRGLIQMYPDYRPHIKFYCRINETDVIVKPYNLCTALLLRHIAMPLVCAGISEYTDDHGNRYTFDDGNLCVQPSMPVNHIKVDVKVAKIADFCASNG